MKAEDDGDTIGFTFESEDSARTSQFEMKLMDIDSEHLGIPETEYKVVVKMPANEFQRIVRDLGVLGDTCTIGVTKEGVRFMVNGDLGERRRAGARPCLLAARAHAHQPARCAPPSSSTLRRHGQHRPEAEHV